MKKNFLLLLLMSLLPLAGWAADVSIVTWPTLNDAVDYDGSAKQVIKTVGVATGSEVPTIYYAVTTATSAPAADADVWVTDITDAKVKVTAAGTYYAWIKVTAGDDEMDPTSIPGSFEIKKVDATITTGPSKVDGLVYNGVAQTLINDESVEYSGATGMQYSLDQETWSTELPTATNAGTYTVYYKAIGDENHNDKTGNLTTPTIARKEYEAGKFSVTLPSPSTFYNGAKQDAQYVVKFTKADETEETLTLGTDFVLSYKVGVEDKDPKDVAVYKASIGSKTESNFDLTIDNATLEGIATGLGNWEIKKLPISVMAKPQEKVYDGTVTLPSEEKGTAYDIVGAVEGETFGAPTLTAAGATVGSQTITIAKGNLFTATAKEANYTVSYTPNTLTVTPIKLAISVDQENAATKREKGQNAPSLTDLQGALVLNATDYEADSQPTIITTEANDIKAAINMEIAGNTLEAATTAAGTFAITLSKLEEDVLKNYDITLTNGTFTVSSDVVTITTLPKSRTYVEEEFDWSTTPKEGVDYMVSGLSGDDKITGIKLSRVPGDDVASYDINATWDAESVPAYYNNVVVVKGKYTITPAEITVTPQDQILLVGDALDQDAYEATGKKDGEDWGDIFKLDFKAGIDTNADGKADVAGVTDDGIAVTLIDNTNYTLSAANTAKLTVINTAEALYLDRDDTRLAATIKAASDACEADENKKYTISFASRVLNAEQWYAMVLPFDITVAELSQAFGYAVVDVLDETKDDGNVHLKLHMGDIEANQPFIVKVASELDLATVDGITARPITYVENPERPDKGGNSFYGTYTKVTKDFGEKEYYMKNGDWQKNANDVTIQSMGAYIKASTAAARIFIEEPDGSTTVINSIGVDKENFSNDGWYNLNGLKLQGAPTQKGVYIQNGKKYVVK